MQIIIPMSGVGQRFIDAGYRDPKPLIPVDGKPIIEHVVNMYPGEDRVLFICNQEHLTHTRLAFELKRIKSLATVVPIAPHKLGPVYAVRQAFDHILDDEPCIVSYCDFSVSWDYQHFKKVMRDKNPDGCITAYKGFHPHTLGSTHYAYMRWDKHNEMLEIREKEAFTAHRMDEYASAGSYYFKSGKILKKYFQACLDRQISKNGEFYVSLVYNLLKQDGLSVYIYELDQFLQWGTPEDLREYQLWSDYFKSKAAWEAAHQTRPVQARTVVLPMAGRGQRFADEGYVLPKPLVPVDGQAMVVKAVEALPKSSSYCFVCLQSLYAEGSVPDVLRQNFLHARFVPLDQVTEGQACTVLLGTQALTDDERCQPLLIGACDNGLVWDEDTFENLLKRQQPDAVLLTAKAHPAALRHPHAYGWVKADAEGRALAVQCKQSFQGDLKDQHAMTGAFYFKNTDTFEVAAKAMIEKNIRVNNEFYVDLVFSELLAQGKRVWVFDVAHYVCWGTPNDVRTYEYWQRYFSKSAKNQVLTEAKG